MFLLLIIQAQFPGPWHGDKAGAPSDLLQGNVSRERASQRGHCPSGVSPFQSEGGGHRFPPAGVLMGSGEDSFPEELSVFPREGGLLGKLIFSFLLALILLLGSQVSK